MPNNPTLPILAEEIRLCACGCGLPAPKVKRNNARKGHVKGQHLRFVSGHNKAGTADLSRYREDESGCWIWQGPPNRKGYGRSQVRGVHMNAHRAVYLGHGLVIPPGLHLDHLCRKTMCVNPVHMEPVTPAENNRRKRSNWADEVSE